MTDQFRYKKNGMLYAEDVSISRMVKEVGTPFYCYSSKKLEKNYNTLKKATKDIDNVLICYAMKANSNQAVIKTLANLGAGADIVSVGELKRAEAAGISRKKIVFAGVGKTKDEIDYAIKKGILCFNVESKSELQMISQRAKALDKIATVSFRINPNVDALTHEKISTGKNQNKFGVPYKDAVDLFKYAVKLPDVQINGIDVHIGSQITSLTPYRKTFKRVTEIVGTLRQKGYNIRHVNVGGGLGINYGDNKRTIDVNKYAKLLQQYAKKWDTQVILEPGRYIAGNAGILVTEVIRVKQGGIKKMFVVVDAAMNDLLRPTLYNAHHEIIPARASNRKEITTDVVGPICETGDYLALKREIKNVKEGEILALKDAGAYGAVQSSTYNSRELIPEVMVKGNKFHVVRKRQKINDIIKLDSMPKWIK